MPTKEQLSQMWEVEMEFPSTRREDDPMYVKPREPMNFNNRPLNIIPEIIDFLNQNFDHQGCPNETARHARDYDGNYKLWIYGLDQPREYVLNVKAIELMEFKSLNDFLLIIQREFVEAGFSFPFASQIKETI